VVSVAVENHGSANPGTVTRLRSHASVSKRVVDCAVNVMVPTLQADRASAGAAGSTIGVDPWYLRFSIRTPSGAVAAMAFR